MKHSEVLSRYVNTGIEIPEEQYERLTTVLKKSYLRIRRVAGNYSRWELKYINDDEKINYIGRKGKELDIKDLRYLISISSNKDNFITKIIDVKGVELKREYDVYVSLLEYSENKDDIATKIIEAMGKEYPNSLYGYVIKNFLDYSVNKDDIIKKIIEVKNIHLNDDNIILLLQYSSNKNDTATKIIEIIGPKLNLNIIRPFLHYLSAPVNVDLIDMDDLITKIIKVKGEELDYDEFKYLLRYSSNKNDIRIKVIEAKGDKLSDEDIIDLLISTLYKNIIDIPIKIIEVKGEKLNYEQISLLLSLPKDKELIKKTLLQNGVDYKLINDVITNDNIDTPLIPDNYQSMLNEIRRIKEIMI